MLSIFHIPKSTAREQTNMRALNMSTGDRVYPEQSEKEERRDGWCEVEELKRWE